MLRKQHLVAIVALAGMLCHPSFASAQTAPTLGTAESYAVIGGATVTNTGSSIITGDLGLSPGSAVTGFPPGLVTGGTIHAADAAALQAQNDVITAYNALVGQACTSDLTGQDLGGLTLTPGVYCFSSSAQLTGTLTLNGQGNPNAVFIFKTGSTLTTASGSSVSVINGGQVCNIFWQVGSSATLGTSSTMRGNLLALTSVILTTGAQVFGRTIARNGSVTLDGNTVTRSICAPVGPCPAITLTPATLPTPTVGLAYTQTITGSVGTPPYVFTITAGTLPPGLSLTSAGVVSGTPTTAATSPVTIRGTDAAGCFADVVYTVTVLPAVPTLSGWAMIILTALLCLAGVAAMRRRAI